MGLGELQGSTVSSAELERSTRRLEVEHDPGTARPVGPTSVQAVHYQGRWVALMAWGPAALKPADHDNNIGRPLMENTCATLP